MASRILLFAALLAVWAAPAQAEGCRVDNGTDYTFERTSAVRVVHDEYDQGSISLATYIYRPLRNDRRTVVLFSHGSTNGQSTDPAEPQLVVPCALKNYFLSRGYTLVAATRRGRGASTGTFIEECARNADPACTPARNREMSPRALEEALADSVAVLDQVVYARLARPGERIILAGHSRGGFLALALAAQRREQVAAVINFSGGWLGFQPQLIDGPEAGLRLAFHEALLRRYAAFGGPTLWLYADRDSFYSEDITRRLFDGYIGAGGRGGYVRFSNHPLENGHLLIQESPLWSDAADAFLAEIPVNPAP